MLTSLFANLLSLFGLLFLGWSLWTVVAIYWIENLVHLPFLARRIARAFPHLTPTQLEAYLKARDSERSNGVNEGQRLRDAIRDHGLAEVGQLAGWRFLVFYGAFALAHGLFVFLIGGVAASGELPADTLDFGVFEPLAILGAGLALAITEAIALRLDPKPAMPDTGAYTRRMVVLHLTVIFGGFALTVAGGAALAVVFVALKTVADLGVGRVAAGVRSVAGGR